jgi:uncharacterized membrane protein
LSNAVLRAGLLPHWPLVARVRALAALFGVAAVVAMFLAMRQGFDRRTSLTAAAMTAVSPYAVMLSREARNYSCAMLLVTCALGAVLALVRCIDERRPTIAWWVAWSAASAAGLYIHYFTLFAFIAQARRSCVGRSRPPHSVACVSPSSSPLSHFCRGFQRWWFSRAALNSAG